MSKSLGNSIGITDAPEEMYGKVMSLPDASIAEYFDALSGGEWEEDRPAVDALRAGGGDPMAVKQRLAMRIVARIHGGHGAEAGRAHFQKVVQQKGVPDDVPEAELDLAGAESVSLLDALDALGLVKSRSEGRRLVDQGAVAIDGERVTDALAPLVQATYLLRLGKRRYVQLTVRS